MKITLLKIIAAMALSFLIMLAVTLIDNRLIGHIYMVIIFSLFTSAAASAWYFNRVSRANPWIIRKGWNWANYFYWIPFYDKTEFEFHFVIYKDSLLTNEDLVGMSDAEKTEITTQINKLFGASFNGWFGGNHKNSIRTGWCDDNMKGKPNLFNYTYSDGKRVIDESVGREPWIGAIYPSNEFKCRIKLKREENASVIEIINPIHDIVIFASLVPVDASKFSKWGRISLPEFENNPKRMKFKAQLTSMK